MNERRGGTMDAKLTTDPDLGVLSLRPLVTVVTPVFNGERCLQRCLDSVAAQSWPNIEHIVVDIAS
jgi:cellulose synthase/poly-beta-1,6-N-acetylglucosamine synthase-like glycosyltransferase